MLGLSKNFGFPMKQMQSEQQTLHLAQVCGRICLFSHRVGKNEPSPSIRPGNPVSKYLCGKQVVGILVALGLHLHA
jgi:hypothetical protein